MTEIKQASLLGAKLGEKFIMIRNFDPEGNILYVLGECYYAGTSEKVLSFEEVYMTFLAQNPKKEGNVKYREHCKKFFDEKYTGDPIYAHKFITSNGSEIWSFYGTAVTPEVYQKYIKEYPSVTVFHVKPVVIP